MPAERPLSAPEPETGPELKEALPAEETDEYMVVMPDEVGDGHLDQPFSETAYVGRWHSHPTIPVYWVTVAVVHVDDAEFVAEALNQRTPRTV